MKTISFPIYTFDELNETAKEVARSWFKECIDVNDYADVIEDADTISRKLGFVDPRIQWSGFATQGDGACISGVWDSSKVSNMKEIKSEYPTDTRLHYIAEIFENFSSHFPEVQVVLESKGMYSHEHSVNFDFTGAEVFRNENCIAFSDICRTLMKWIYWRLEKQNEFLYSNESVDENIKANKYWFTAAGKRTIYVGDGT